MKQHVPSIIASAFLIAANCTIASPSLYIDDASGRLGIVDVSTGTTTIVGSMGTALTDIAFAPNGDLYGLSFTNLYRINSQTAALTPIGPHGISGGNALVFGTNGILYGAGNTSTGLFSINISTGAATLLGNIGFRSSGDLAFNNGQLYLSSTTNQLVQINQATFAGTALGPLGFSSVFGLATGDDGVLYGLSGTQIFSVNPSTMAVTPVVNYQGHGLSQAYGTTFISEAVPEPSAILLTAPGFVGIVLLRGRSRKRLTCG
ncbi:MAG TPA: hypothetical protein VIT91_11625 [Chthoniobacterales bacterium]